MPDCFPGTSSFDLYRPPALTSAKDTVLSPRKDIPLKNRFSVLKSEEGNEGTSPKTEAQYNFSESWAGDRAVHLQRKDYAGPPRSKDWDSHELELYRDKLLKNPMKIELKHEIAKDRRFG
jgi:hypothetical protein